MTFLAGLSALCKSGVHYIMVYFGNCLIVNLTDGILLSHFKWQLNVFHFGSQLAILHGEMFFLFAYACWRVLSYLLVGFQPRLDVVNTPGIN